MDIEQEATIKNLNTMLSSERAQRGASDKRAAKAEARIKKLEIEQVDCAAKHRAEHHEQFMKLIGHERMLSHVYEVLFRMMYDGCGSSLETIGQLLDGMEKGDCGKLDRNNELMKIIGSTGPFDTEPNSKTFRSCMDARNKDLSVQRSALGEAMSNHPRTQFHPCVHDLAWEGLGRPGETTNLQACSEQAKPPNR